MRIVFMGTPDFAACALKAVADAGHDIVLVVTQPDKAKGRSGQPQFPPVKQFAVQRGLPVWQPEKIKEPEAVARLKEIEADVYVVAAFGQILTQEILDIPKFGCINIHASLLPKYRGASPIQHVIIDGETKTGITIMQMDAGIDTGDILYVRETEISDTDTFETLHDRLAVLGGEAIAEALPRIERGELVPRKQEESLSCYAPLLKKAMGEIDFARDAFAIDRQIRGMTPWPSAYTFCRGKQLKLWRAAPVELRGETQPPGTVTEVAKDHIQVACGENALCIYELQLEGKKRMQTREFLPGVRIQPGERLGQR